MTDVVLFCPLFFCPISLNIEHGWRGNTTNNRIHLGTQVTTAGIVELKCARLTLGVVM